MKAVKTIIIMQVLTVFSFQLVSQDIRIDVSELESKIDSLVSEVVRPEGPGLIVTITRGQNLLINKGYGYARLENKIPVYPESVFNIGSVAKQFTAYAITLLEIDGKLSLDDNVLMYLPELPEYCRKIKISNLLYHTSGLRDELHLWVLSGKIFGDIVTATDLFDLIKRQDHLLFEPGTQYDYSDTNYSLLAMIISKVTGESYRQWMDSNIFFPLEMKSTVVKNDNNMIVRNIASSYYYDSEGCKYMPLNSSNVGPTNLYTSGNDMAKWLMNFDSGKLGGEEVFNYFTEKGLLYNGDTIQYARGITVETNRGYKVLRHGGTEGTYNSEMIFLADLGLGISVLSNFGSNPGRIINEIIKVILPDNEIVASGLSTEKRTNNNRKVVIDENAVKLNNKQLDRFTGTFWFSQSDNWSTREIRSEDGKLFYVRSPLSKTELIPLSDSTLRLIGTEIVIGMDKVLDNRYTRLKFNISGNNPSVAIRIEPFIADRNNLIDYEGLYYSRELDALHRFEVKNNSLYNTSMRFFGDNPLTIVKKDLFSFGNGDGHITFMRNSENEVTGFTLYAPRVGDLDFTKLEQK